MAFMALVALGGCSATIGQKHHFAVYNGASTEPVNFFRLTISGGASMSGARYVSGYYDERAVDLFFNEIRTAQKSPAIFEANLVNPGTTQKIEPLNPGAEHGAFVLLLSTNADSVVNTIGSFAESEVVAESITNLINSDKIRSKALSDARATPLRAGATALVTQIDALLPASDATTTPAGARESYLRVLSVLAQARGYRGSFTTFDEARQWMSKSMEAVP